ncbi:MAG: hypothetical protein A2V90_04335 [Gammaproteobacteria bacterium RBG_16_57_12]|nr:MAG: hypothetical protein A2V90_04335 [Gammaproteobacteria bacterium RBG_16_57_12]
MSTTPVNFGAYNVFGLTPADSQGGISVTCTQNNNLSVRVMVGPSATSGAFIPRQLLQSSGTDKLTYNLYTQATYATVWGDGTGSTATRTRNVRASRPWNTAIYGRIPPGQDVAVGSYSDTLTVTIIF